MDLVPRRRYSQNRQTCQTCLTHRLLCRKRLVVLALAALVFGSACDGGETSDDGTPGPGAPGPGAPGPGAPGPGANDASGTPEGTGATDGTGQADQSVGTGDGTGSGTGAPALGTGEGVNDGTGTGNAFIHPAEQAVSEALALFESEGPEAGVGRVQLAVDSQILDFHMVATIYADELRSRGHAEAAVTFLLGNLERNPEDHFARMSLANTYNQQMRWAEAEALFGAIGPEAMGLYNMARLNRTTSLRRLGRFDDARAALESSEFGSYQEYVTASLCDIDLSQGLFDDCRARIDASVTGDRPSETMIENAIALAYLEGDMERATQLLGLLDVHIDRIKTLIVLLNLSVELPEAAMAALQTLGVPTLAGEHDALRALVMASGGDREGARPHLLSAVASNVMLAEQPEVVGQILHWRPEIVTLWRELLEEAMTPE